MKRPLALFAALALIAVAAFGASGAGASQPTAHAAATTVKLKDSFMSPSSVSVRRGGSVRFVWTGRIVHNLVGPGVPRSYGTPKVRHAPLTVKLRRKGSFSFSCTLHPGMRAVVKVR